MSHYIKPVDEHFVVFDDRYRFILSADTEEEAFHDLGKYLADEYRSHR